MWRHTPIPPFRIFCPLQGRHNTFFCFIYTNGEKQTRSKEKKKILRKYKSGANNPKCLFAPSKYTSSVVAGCVAKKKKPKTEKKNTRIEMQRIRATNNSNSEWRASMAARDSSHNRAGPWRLYPHRWGWWWQAAIGRPHYYLLAFRNYYGATVFEYFFQFVFHSCRYFSKKLTKKRNV